MITPERTNDHLGASPPSGHHTGTFGLNRDYIYAYKIYIRSKDYDKAEYLIRK